MDLLVAGGAAYAYTAGHTLRPERPSIVFVHGAANDHSVFLLQSRYFAYHGYNALAVDLPGHGRTAGPPLPTIGAIADWIAALLAAAEIDAALLVGHSMGALAALECGARYPHAVRGLTLIGVAAPMPVTEALLGAAGSGSAAARDMLNIWGHSTRAHLGGNPVPGMWLTGANIRLLERTPPAVLHADLKACNDYDDGLVSAAKIACPTLLVLGRRDMLTPARNAKALAATLRDARTVTLQDAGHAITTEQPDALLDALIAFVSDHPASFSSTG